jgi:hypothetical protein
MSGLQPSASLALVTQGFALGWDVAAPLALSKGKCYAAANAMQWQTLRNGKRYAMANAELLGVDASLFGGEGYAVDG